MRPPNPGSAQESATCPTTVRPAIHAPVCRPRSRPSPPATTSTGRSRDPRPPASRALGRRWPRSSSRTPIGPACSWPPSLGIDAARAPGRRGRRTRPPVHRGRDRTDAAFDREASAADRGVVRRRVPAARRREWRRRGRPRVDRHGLAGAAPLSTTERETLTALAIARRRSPSIGPGSPRRPSERSEWFERMAHTDPLTGLANERTVARILELEIARAGARAARCRSRCSTSTTSTPPTARAAHEAGDDVLRRVAAVLAESVRLVDTVGRIGGDEFVLVAPGLGGRDGRPPGHRRDRGPARRRRADRVGLRGRRPVPGGRHRRRVADRGRDGRPRHGLGPRVRRAAPGSPPTAVARA